MSIPVTKTMSAHSMSETRSSFEAFRSIRRFSQGGGSRAETVSNPSGGYALRLPTIFNACLNPQYVSGNSGLIIKTRILQILLWIVNFFYLVIGIRYIVPYHAVKSKL